MIIDRYESLKLKKFQIQCLSVQSRALQGNALSDPVDRKMPILVAKKPKVVVWVLAGFGGNGPNYLNLRGYEKNFAENLDDWRNAPAAVYVFVDAWTKVGGSQFINSPAVGKYEDYIVKDLYKEVKKAFPDLPHAVMGGSSGGYGALHLASKHPDKFSYCGAIAPDAFFEAMFLPEFLKTSNFFANKKVDANKLDEILELRDWHSIMNVYAMSLIYSEGKIPFDFHYGKLIPSLWRKWQAKDPVQFLPKRKESLKKLKGLFLEVGYKDQFYLQFGARQIHSQLKKDRIRHHYHEFNGNHFDLSTRREPFLQWLNSNL
tara:strand:- start:11380 stop:12330 length:951 start_codon:yes stop_codon:yes gene_type:complete